MQASKFIDRRRSIFTQGWVVQCTYPQSGAGHHLQSGSIINRRLKVNSSYLFINISSWRTSLMSFGWSGSAHSGHAMFTRLSVISIFKYCPRHSRHDRCSHVMMSGNWSLGRSIRHSGHSMVPENLLEELLRWEVLRMETARRYDLGGGELLLLAVSRLPRRCLDDRCRKRGMKLVCFLRLTESVVAWEVPDWMERVSISGPFMVSDVPKNGWLLLIVLSAAQVITNEKVYMLEIIVVLFKINETKWHCLLQQAFTLQSMDIEFKPGMQ